MQPSNIDLNLLRVFIAVYQHRSITVAADTMGLTQPGVSGVLKRLQQQLGVQLFVRSGRGIEPTHQAHELARQVEPALNQIRNALEGIESFSTENSRRFVVYTSEPVMLMLLPRIEADNTLGNVEIELHPTLSSETKLINNLNQQKADLAIDFAHYSAPSFFSEFFLNDEICLIARKGHPRIQQTLSLEQFYREKHVTLKLRREDAYLADLFTEESIEERKVAAECDSLVSQMTMISNSDCLAATVKSIANQFAERLDLQVLDAPFTNIPIKYRLLAHNRMKHSPANIWLRDKLRSYFAAES
ncbi:LysR family transcriptional regulator [Vibrio rotiferianus]|uniref:LysR family transcriptional regulator n=1 Tax=Vibrio harveyi group TaxID=717610 RepID=UPI00023759C1|nr:LysR family transcriptional regulator [Vibrio rotiferianus]HDM8232626.1 LysR family transcriptional regulator [Vibrio campbellii]ASI93926.1 LysR family transcriptional regulator [Vibrio rotiferianus]NOH66616.1 LysR family transcriptional regulator [Vibrio rotiferianus]TMX42486.1 LysR family transcriptional regulator [Vibrio rotiferianus]TMX43477.1 LysR family transcriptional regulator [Vibrio rotiferianus]